MSQPLSIRVRVRLFAMQREQAGTRSLDLELPAGATVEDAWAALVQRHPVLAPGREAVRFARNAEYASPDEPLADGDELACIPPVSGGAMRGSIGGSMRGSIGGSTRSLGACSRDRCPSTQSLRRRATAGDDPPHESVAARPTALRSPADG